MLDFELNHLNESPEWRLILEEYQRREAQLKTSDPESDGWVPRISSLNEVKDEELPKIHGKLIAVGYLKFQLSGRSTGVKYQISPAGKLALKNKAIVVENQADNGAAKKSA
jgi:hypothetical protein